MFGYEPFILLSQAEHKPELNCYDSDWMTPSYEHATRRVTRSYSLSKSFLQIEPKPDTLSCGSSAEVQVHYIFTPEAIGEQKKIVIYYLVRHIWCYLGVTATESTMSPLAMFHDEQPEHCQMESIWNG